MKLSVSLAVVCGTLVLFMACKKKEDDDKDNIAKSPAGQMLVNGKWQMTAATATMTYMGSDTTIDRFAEMDICDKDDFITFIKDGNVLMDEGANKCTYDDQVERGTWKLLDNDTKIAIADSNPDTMGFEINAAEMKWKLTSKNSAGTPIYNVYTFKNIK